MSKYIIGVDLGTTNCTMAYARKDSETLQIEQFSIPQIVSENMQGEHPCLPSFLYFPLEGERANGVCSIDWDIERPFCLGLYARERGAELSYQLVSSSKSWLCHDGIDRRSELLPLNNDRDKISPVKTCAELLKHLREVWDLKNESDSFVDQTVLVTVPASFDPSARQLVQEAANMAGYPESMLLLEEPQAAFYSWLYHNGDQWRKKLAVGDDILVVDVGGGTTDFSLISVVDNDGNLELERTAVGSHLLLGGDNMDWALAYLAKGKLEDQGHNIDDWQLASLVHGCRKAKEILMSSDHPDNYDITIQGKGSSLMASSLTVTLLYQEVYDLLLNGFIPMVDPAETSTVEKRSGMRTVGLPYAQDARISCQLARFLSRSLDETDSLDNFVFPSAIMFNGGTVKSAVVQERIVALLNSWADTLGKSHVKILENDDLDCAVSRGATYYGLSRLGKGIRIKGGTSRSYYIGVEEAVPAIPGMPIPMKALCVVPYGMEEGSELSLDEQEFALVLGESASFRFFSREVPLLSDGKEPHMGDSLRNWRHELKELHPIETVLEKSDGDGKTVKVTLHSKVTELGVLELWCIAEDGRKWKLEFDLRHPSK